MMPIKTILVLVAMCAAAAPGRAGEVADGIHLLPGRFVPGSQPDGNTVVLEAPTGLIVVDTGRHPAHTQSILDFAARARLPIAAIVNTHWHLDHIGGNPRLRRAHPDVRVWASDALAGAMTGFLADYRAQLVGALARADLDSTTAATMSAELAILDQGDALVTLPVPLPDTAYPRRWQAALAHLAEIDFALLVPGHGPVMTREDFARYRVAFGNLLDRAAADSSSTACAEGWLHDIGPLVPADEHAFARILLDYYVDNHLHP